MTMQCLVFIASFQRPFAILQRTCLHVWTGLVCAPIWDGLKGSNFLIYKIIWFDIIIKLRILKALYNN